METIKKIDVAAIASDLVKIPSYSHMERQEEQVGAYISRYFQMPGIQVEQQQVEPGRANIIVKLPGTGRGKSLMLCGHMDTVPLYDMENGFSGTVRDGRLYGRGACDMKGPLAAMMAALAGIRQAGVLLEGDLYFCALTDEEEQGRGVQKLVKTGPKASGVIVGEPTGMDICLGHKGLEWIRIAVYGKKVHGGKPEEGINAVTMASHLVHCLDAEYAKALGQRTHPVLGASTVNVGAMKGGDQPSIVPDFCEITLDRRYVPGETREQVYTELREVMEKVQADYPDFRGEVQPFFKDVSLLPQGPFCVAEDSALVRHVREAVGKLGAGPKKITAFPAWTDAGTIYRETGSPCIIMGPGQLSLAHSANESIGVKELEEAAAIYGMTALEYCGVCGNETKNY